MQRAVCSVQRASCSVQRAACSVQCAVCSVQCVHLSGKGRREVEGQAAKPKHPGPPWVEYLYRYGRIKRVDCSHTRDIYQGAPHWEEAVQASPNGLSSILYSYIGKCHSGENYENEVK